MFRAEVWLFTTLFAVGVIAGMGTLMLYPAKPDRDTSRENPKVANALVQDLLDQATLQEIDGEESQAVSDYIRAGDRSLLSGNFHVATARYKKALKKSTRPSVPLALRLATCAERTENPLLAERLYDQVLRSTGTPVHRRLATLGLIRVWQQLQREGDAYRAATELFLQAEENKGLPIALQSQLVYELAALQQKKALDDYHFDLSREDGVAFHVETPDLTTIIEAIDNADQFTATPDASEDSAIKDGITLVQRPGNSPSVTILAARTETRPLKQLLVELGTISQFQIQATDRANSKLSARSRLLHFRNLPLSVVLDSLLSPLGLTWIQKDSSIQVVDMEEFIDLDRRRELSIDIADRTLRQFALTFPGDYRYASVLLSRGNFNLLKDDADSAANYYEIVAQSNPTGELRAKLSFNTGRLSVMLGRRSLAIDQLYLAVDQSYDPEIKSCGYRLIGHLFLEMFDLDNAVYAAGRALSVARSTRQKQLASLTLARIYLFRNDPASANQVFFRNRKEFDNSPLRKTGTILSNYAQYIGVEDEYGRHVAEERLIYSLSTTTPEHFDSFFDYYVAGRAYLDLGFNAKAIHYLKIAANQATTSTWKNQILFTLGVTNERTGQEKDAGEIFDFLITEDSDRWGRLARLQLADLYLRNQMAKECLTVCNDLMQMELTDAQRKKVLTMMGYSYRALDQHHTSALCFAGIYAAEKNDPQEVTK